MSEQFEGEEWKRALPTPPVNLRPRSRAEQQAWIDEQYGRRKIGLREWRFQFDLISFENTDGSFPPEVDGL